MTAQDLASFSAEWVEPISTEYRGWKIYELPPNSQGLAVLEMLNIMETSGAAAGGPYNAAELHRRIESMKLAYSDLRFNGDPHFVDIPVRGLLSKDYARKRAAAIDPQKANCAAPAGAPVFGETTT
jgi:gamma-glutamyltranspeptidase/glutathione hydrolase